MKEAALGSGGEGHGTEAVASRRLLGGEGGSEIEETSREGEMRPVKPVSVFQAVNVIRNIGSFPIGNLIFPFQL